MIIAIQPVPAFPATATQIDVSDGHVSLGATASFQYVLLDAEGRQVSPASRNTLTAEQYAAWTGDDEFVAQCVAENIGLTPV